MEQWCKEWRLKANEEKTEYMVVGTGIQQRFWTENGTMIRSRNSIKYLGFSRNSKEEDHLTHRVEQTKKASLTVHSILQQLPDLPIEKQI